MCSLMEGSGVWNLEDTHNDIYQCQRNVNFEFGMNLEWNEHSQQQYDKMK